MQGSWKFVEHREVYSVSPKRLRDFLEFQINGRRYTFRKTFQQKTETFVYYYTITY